MTIYDEAREAFLGAPLFLQWIDAQEKLAEAQLPPTTTRFSTLSLNPTTEGRVRAILRKDEDIHLDTSDRLTIIVHETDEPINCPDTIRETIAAFGDGKWKKLPWRVQADIAVGFRLAIVLSYAAQNPALKETVTKILTPDSQEPPHA